MVENGCYSLALTHGLLIAVAALAPDYGLYLEHAGSVVAHGFSCSTACWTFVDQGSNPCPLHLQADF